MCATPSPKEAPVLQHKDGNTASTGFLLSTHGNLPAMRLFTHAFLLTVCARHQAGTSAASPGARDAVSITSSATCDAVIVYVGMRQQAESIAQHLFVNGVSSLAYHGSKRRDERARVEDLFARRKLRCVVATVAFGMGVDVPHVGGVVHVGMPRSVEEYVQQVGRAGRSGKEEHCYLLLSGA